MLLFSNAHIQLLPVLTVSECTDEVHQLTIVLLDLYSTGSDMNWFYKFEVSHRDDQLSKSIWVVEARCKKCELPTIIDDALQSVVYAAFTPINTQYDIAVPIIRERLTT